tara:strand:+ start:3077 stop:4264 length:1188 start_codon:yes stop_codon:yes gene_type:complete
MKSFKKFISEIVTQASTQATKMGLKGDGHGDWYDKEGNLVAKTVNAKLKFFGKKRPPTADERTKIEVNKQTAAKEDEKAEREEIRKREGDPADITVAFGRFNPPTVGHEKLLNRVKSVAGKGEYAIYPSRSNDPKKNPLDPEEKISYMQQMFPKHSERIVNDPESKTIFDVLKKSNAAGARSINIVVGADRLKEFENLANKYNGKLYDYDRIRVISAGERDAESEGVEGMSASKLRKAVASDDFESFSKGLPKGFGDENMKKLYSSLKKSMGVSEMWMIAPKFDWKNLRENYVNGNIFNVDDIVENDNTGLVGKILRRGANYIIAVTEGNMMFKSWIKDLSEWTNVSGVPADQRLIGTDAHRKYVQSISHPQAYRTVPIKKFINKFREKRAKKNA